MIQKKPFYFATLFSLFLLLGCSSPAEQEKDVKVDVSKELTPELVTFANQYKLSVVLSKKGCTGCNKKIVKITESIIANGGFGTIIETTGRNYDISNILADDYAKNVHVDYKRQLTKNLKAESSFFLYYPNGIEGEGVEKHEITVKNMDSFEKLLTNYLAKK